MKKLFAFFLPAVLIMLFISSCKQSGTEPPATPQYKWIRFEWMGDSLGSEYFERAAMYLPFRIDKIPYTFKAQFDLGAPSTMVYGNTMERLIELYPWLADRLDTVNKSFVIQGQRVGQLTDITFYLDTVRFSHQTVAYFQGFGDPLPQGDLSAVAGKTVIGTLGSNLFRDRVLIIDFPNRRMAIVDSLPGVDTSGLVDISVVHGFIIVPIEINGKVYKVIYDTGSSIFTLFMSTNNWDMFREKDSKIDTLTATAWGVKYSILRAKAGIDVTIAGQTIRPDVVWATSRDDYYNFFKQMGIVGLMGNAMFYDKVLLIDFRDNKFGVIKM